MPILSQERVFPRKFLALYVYPPKARFIALFVAFPNIIHIPDNESIEELYGIRRRYFMLINKKKKKIYKYHLMIFLYRRSSRTHQSMQTNYTSNATLNLSTHRAKNNL